MSSIIFSERIAPNFTLGSALNWMDRQANMSATDREICREIVHRAYIQNIDKIHPRLVIKAQYMQSIRNFANSKLFKDHLKSLNLRLSNDLEFGITCLSWYRPLEWEMYRRRNGTSQHVEAWANDWLLVPVKGTCSNMNAASIEIFKVLWETHQGGVASKKDGNRIVFIHTDLRPKRVPFSY